MANSHAGGMKHFWLLFYQKWIKNFHICNQQPHAGMIYRCLLIAMATICLQQGYAQTADLQVQGSSPNLYLVHTVQAKENWYSIGRLYNVSPKQLAPYNSLSMDKALSIGQSLKIPLTSENYSSDGVAKSDEALIPVKHTIQEKEWLYRISTNYNKVPVENLEKWNHINKDQAKAGLSITVGYLKVKGTQSAFATGNKSVAPAATAVAAKETPKTIPQEEKKTSTAVPAANDPVAVKYNPPANSASTQGGTTATTTAPLSTVTTATKPSFFKPQYDETGKSMSGNAGIFKSTSGWDDGKYYALVNNVAVGTIIRINNPTSGRFVYAKVLGNLPDMKESQGLIARLSDAAAAQLDATGNKFSVELRF